MLGNASACEFLVSPPGAVTCVDELDAAGCAAPADYDGGLPLVAAKRPHRAPKQDVVPRNFGHDAPHAAAAAAVGIVLVIRPSSFAMNSRNAASRAIRRSMSWYA
jgi:hypothetical protein